MSNRWLKGLGLLTLLASLSAAWAYASPRIAAASPGTGALLGVASSSGRVRISAPSSWRELALPVASSRSVDARFSVGVNAQPSGRGANVIVVARRSAAGEYRVRAHIAPDWTVTLSVVRVSGGTRRAIAESAPLAGLVHAVGDRFVLRTSVSSNVAPRIAAKAWPAGTAEPSDWSLTTTDTARAVGGAGWSGIRFAVGHQVTTLPMTFAYGSLRASTDDPATDPGSSGDPQPTPTPTPTTTPSPSSSEQPSPTASPSAAPTTSPSPSPSPSATPSPSASPSPVSTQLPVGAFVVATNGSDSASGSSAAPWRTLQHAADTVLAGATVYVRGGTYDGFTLRHSGTSSRPITFTAFPGEQPVIDGRGVLGYTVQLMGVRNVALDSLTVQGGYMDKQAGGGILVQGSANVSITHDTIRNNHSFGVRTENSENVLIDSNDVYGNAVGVHIGWDGAGTVVSNNDIHNNDQMMVNTPDIKGDDAGGEGVAIVHSSGPVTVSDNQIWANRAVSYDYGYDGGAFSIYAASGWHITGNTTWDNHNILETGTDANKTPCDGNSFTRNLNYGATTADMTVGMVLRCASNTLVANNTFAGMQYFVFALSNNQGTWGGSTDGMRIENNVVWVSTGKVYGIDTTLPSDVVIDHNVVFDAGSGYLATYLGQGTKSLAQLTAWTGFEAHSVQANAQFVDPTGHDFRLSAGSPALDFGVAVAGVTDSYAGSAPDAGYAERR